MTMYILYLFNVLTPSQSSIENVGASSSADEDALGEFNGETSFIAPLSVLAGAEDDGVPAPFNSVSANSPVLTAVEAAV